jgi:hypothetical protein
MFNETIIKILDTYKSNNVVPKRNLFFEEDPKVKEDPAWYYALGQKILHDYVNDRYTTNDARQYFSYSTRSIRTLREYAHGRQPVQKYLDHLCPPETRLKFGTGGNQVEMAMMNISQSPPKIFPIFRSVVKGVLLDTDYDFDILGIDPTSDSYREQEIAYQKMLMSDQVNILKKELEEMGYPIQTEQPKFENEQELDLINQQGGFKLAYEIELKKALLKSLSESKYDGIRDMLLDDLIDLNLILTKTYVDEVDGTPKARYADPEMFIGAWSRYHDKRDMWLGAEIVPMTLSDLLRQGDIDVQTASYIIENYGKNLGQVPYVVGSPTIGRRNKTNITDDLRVWVLDCSFLSTDSRRYTKLKATERYGNGLFNEVSNDYELSNKDIKEGKEIIDAKTEREYGFKMVIGTNVVFSYGKQKTAYRKKDNKAILSYQMYDLELPSLVERCVEYIDDLTLATYKIRDAVAKMPPPPMLQVDVAAMQNITIGGIKLTPLQTQDMFTQRGWLLIKSLTDHQENVTGNYNAPITPININFEGLINGYFLQVNNAIQNIRLMTGINETIDATNPSPKVGYGVSKMAVDAAKNTLKPMIFGYERLYIDLLKSLNQYWLSVARAGDVKGSFISLGDNAKKVFSLAKDIADKDFDILARLLPSMAERELMIQEILTLKQGRMQNGQGGLMPDVAMMLIRTIKSGNLELAQIKLSQAIQKQIEDDRKYADDREKANTERLMASAQEANKGKQIEVEGRLKEIELEANLELRNALIINKHKSGLSIEQAKMEADMEISKLGATAGNEAPTMR